MKVTLEVHRLWLAMLYFIAALASWHAEVPTWINAALHHAMEVVAVFFWTSMSCYQFLTWAAIAFLEKRDAD